MVTGSFLCKTFANPRRSIIPIFHDSGALRSRMSFSKAHFIGIAGKGMSATALLLRQMGVRITGSDEGFYPPVSDYLRNEGIAFAEGYRKENIPEDADVI